MCILLMIRVEYTVFYKQPPLLDIMYSDIHRLSKQSGGKLFFHIVWFQIHFSIFVHSVVSNSNVTCSCICLLVFILSCVFLQVDRT